MTAFAILALHAFDAEDFSTEISNGLDYLASLQQLSGQILAFPGASTTTSGGVEVHGEALYTLATAMDPAAVPEPGTIATFALGLIDLGVIRRRRIV